MSELTGKRCGEQKLKQLIKLLCENCTVQHGTYNNDTFNPDLYKEMVLDVATIDQRCGFRGVLGKPMNYFINGLSGLDLIICEKLFEDNDQTELKDKTRHCFGKVIYIDLVAFKPLNDNFSEKAGDIILAYIANRLDALISEIDKAFMFVRKGGDEFLVYRMSVPYCEHNDIAIERKQDSVRYDLNAELESRFAELETEEKIIFAPKNEEGNYLLLDITGKQPYELIPEDASGYSFYYIIRGFKARFGIGDNPEKAYEDSKKHKIIVPRGEFYEGMRLRHRGEWLSLNEYIIIITHDRPCAEYIKKYSQLDIELSHDELGAYYIAVEIRRGEDSRPITRQQFLREYALGFREFLRERSTQHIEGLLQDIYTLSRSSLAIFCEEKND